MATKAINDIEAVENSVTAATDVLADIELESAFDEALNDIGGDLNELRGILSEALGDLPFKTAIGFVVLFNFLYILYGAYFGANHFNVIESDCYCNNGDRVFYRIITFGFSTAWILFLVVYATYTTLFHNHIVTRLLEADDKITVERQYERLLVQIHRRRKYLQSQFEELLTTAYLDSEHFRNKKAHLNSLYNRNSNVAFSHDTTSAEKDAQEQASTKPSTREDKKVKNNPSSNLPRRQPKKWYCFMACKLSLLTFRFVFRILIVPLLQLQWVDDYTWNCIMGNFLRDYCKTITNTYFIGLDHSLVLYSVYVLILVALLFSVVINWLPKGVPQVVLEYEGRSDITGFQNFNITRKGTLNYI